MDIRQFPARTPGWIAAFVLLVIVLNMFMAAGLNIGGSINWPWFIALIEAEALGALLMFFFLRG